MSTYSCNKYPSDDFTWDPRAYHRCINCCRVLVLIRSCHECYYKYKSLVVIIAYTPSIYDYLDLYQAGLVNRLCRILPPLLNMFCKSAEEEEDDVDVDVDIDCDGEEPYEMFQ